jgi:restriction system protein
LRAFLTPIRAGSPLIGQSYFAEPLLFITTGSFTPAAVKEATRDGAPPIDLVDGVELAEKLKELALGIKTELVERVSVDEAWFESL